MKNSVIENHPLLEKIDLANIAVILILFAMHIWRVIVIANTLTTTVAKGEELKFALARILLGAVLFVVFSHIARMIWKDELKGVVPVFFISMFAVFTKYGYYYLVTITVVILVVFGLFCLLVKMVKRR